MKSKKSISSATVFFSVMLALALVLPDAAFALQSGDFTYAVSNNTVTITKYTGIGGNVVIPATIDGMPVVSIGDYVFEYFSGLTSVTIPNSVKSIGYGAFFGCTGLTSVTIPDSVLSIEGATFSGCTGLTSVTIPGSVTSIWQYAFSGCTGLTSVTIPDSVTSIGYGAFIGCKRLTRAYFLGNAPSMSMWYGWKLDNYVRAGVFDKCALNFTICYTADSTGFTFPLWYGYPARVCVDNLCAAEAIYGENAEETELLRKYRDTVLNKTPEGQEIIKTYYKVSPTMAKLLEQRPLLKNKAKAVIDSMLPAIREKVEENCKGAP